VTTSAFSGPSFRRYTPHQTDTQMPSNIMLTIDQTLIQTHWNLPLRQNTSHSLKTTIPKYPSMFSLLSIEEHTKSFCVEYLSPHRSRTHHVNLLLFQDESNPSKRHYTHIKNMSALVAHRTKHNGTTYVCNSCLHPFSKQDILDRHIPYSFNTPRSKLFIPTQTMKKTAH